MSASSTQGGHNQFVLVVEVCGHTPDVVIYSKFHRNLFTGTWTSVDRNLPIPITLDVGFYNSLHYRASLAHVSRRLHRRTAKVYAHLAVTRKAKDASDE